MTQAIHFQECLYQDFPYNQSSPDQVSSQLYSILQNYNLIKSNEEMELENLKLLLSQGSYYLKSLKQTQNNFISSLVQEIAHYFKQKINFFDQQKMNQWMVEDMNKQLEKIIKNVYDTNLEQAQNQREKVKQQVQKKIGGLLKLMKDQKKDEIEMRSLISKLQEYSRQNIIQIPVQMEVPKEIYEIPIELQMQSEREYYEIPVQLQLQKEHSNVQTQTESSFNDSLPQKSQRQIYQIPVEMNLLKQTMENSIQTVDYLKSQLLDISTSENLNQSHKINQPKLENLNESKVSHFVFENEENIKEEKSIVQVPVQVIVQKIVEKVIQVPVIIERIVRVQVPVEIQRIVERIVEIETIVQIPVQVIVQRQVPVEIIVQRQIPVEIIVQKQIPVQIIVEREVPVQIIVEKEVIVEREVYIKQIVQIPVETIIEKEVIVQKVVTIKQIVQIPCELIVQSQPIQQQETITLQTPNTFTIEEPHTDNAIYQSSPCDNQDPLELQSAQFNNSVGQLTLQNNQIQRQTQVLQVPVQVIVEKQVIIQKYIQVPVYITKFIQVPIAIQKIVEVPVIIQKSIQVPVEIQKIVQVPVQIEKVIQVPVQILKVFEIPVQLEKTIQVPIQIQKAIQVPVQIEKVIEVPIITQKTVQVHVIIKQIIQVPVQIMVQVPVQVIVEKQVIVQKLVYVKQIVEIPYEVIVEKQVIIQKPIIIKEIVQVPVQVIVQKQVYITENKEQISSAQTIHINHQEPLVNLQTPFTQEEQFNSNIQNLQQNPTNQIQLNNQQQYVQNQDNYQLQSIKLQSHENIIQVPTQLIVQVPVYIQKRIQIPVQIQKIVQVPVYIQKNVEVTVQVQKIIQVPIEIIVQVQKIVQVIKQVIVQVPVKQIIQVPIREIIQVPVQIIQQKIVYVESVPINYNETQNLNQPICALQSAPQQVQSSQKIQNTYLQHYPSKSQGSNIIEVPVQIITQKIVQVPIIQQKILQVPIIQQKIVQIPIIQQRVIQVPIIEQKIVQVIKYVDRQVEVPIIEEKIVQVQKIIQVPIEIIVEVPVQKIIYVPVETIIQVPVQVIVERQIQVPVQIQRIVEKIVQVPVIMDELPQNLQHILVDDQINLQSQYEVEELPLSLQNAPQPLIEQFQPKIQKSSHISVQNVIQVPIEVFIQVPVQKIVQVEVQKIVQVEVQKIVQVFVEVPVEVIIQKIVQVPVYIKEQIIVEKQKQVQMSLDVKQFQQVPQMIQKTHKPLLEIQKLMQPSVQTIYTQIPMTTQKVLGFIDGLEQEKRFELLSQLKQKFQQFYEADKQLYQIPVQIHIQNQEQQQSQKAIYQIPVEIHIAPQDISIDQHEEQQNINQDENDHILLLENSYQNSYEKQEQQIHNTQPFKLQSCPHENQDNNYIENQDNNSNDDEDNNSNDDEDNNGNQLSPYLKSGVQNQIQKNENQQKQGYFDNQQIPCNQLESSNNYQPNFKNETKPPKSLQEIVILDSDSITHEQHQENIEMQPNLQASIPIQQIDENGEEVYEINPIYVGKINMDQSLQFNRDDQFQRLKSLNVSAIKKQTNQEHNLFGSINAVITKQDYGLNKQNNKQENNDNEMNLIPKIQLDYRDTSSFDCGDQTAKQMRIDNSHLLDPHRLSNANYPMPILLQNTQEISKTHDSLSGIREKIIIDDDYLEQLQKTKNQLYILLQDNEHIKKHIELLQDQNHQLQLQLQAKQAQINTLNDKFNTLLQDQNIQTYTISFFNTQFENILNQLTQQNHSFQHQLDTLTQNHKNLLHQFEKVNIQYYELKKKYSAQMEIITNQLYEKKSQIKQLKAQQLDLKNFYQSQLSEITHQLKALKVQIERLETQALKKDDIIERLNYSHQELRGKLCTSLNGQATPQQMIPDVYQKEFLRIRDKFQFESQEKSQKIYELTLIIQNLQEQINKEKQNTKTVQNHLLQSEKNYENLLEINQKQRREHEMRLYQVECRLNEVVLGFQEENFQLRDKNNQKSFLIEKLKRQLTILEEKRTSHASKSKPINESSAYVKVPPTSAKDSEISGLSALSAAIKIQHVANNNQSQKANNNVGYIQKLESMILKYQKIIQSHQDMIQQLQQRVYEYLKDALEKQQEAESFYAKLSQYENTINAILVQKITLELQNKRLRKVITQSEKKLSLLGSQLIKVARQSIDYSAQDYENDFQEQEEQ